MLEYLEVERTIANIQDGLWVESIYRNISPKMIKFIDWTQKKVIAASTAFGDSQDKIWLELSFEQVMGADASDPYRWLGFDKWYLESKAIRAAIEKAYPGCEIQCIGICGTIAKQESEEGWIKVCGYKSCRHSGMSLYLVKADQKKQIDFQSVVSLNPYWFRCLE